MPGKRDLSIGHALLRRNSAEHIYQVLICFAIFGREARNHAAEVGAVKRRTFVDGASQETLAKRTERDEANPKLFERWQNLCLGLSPPKRILTLKSRNGLHRVSAPDGLSAGF